MADLTLIADLARAGLAPELLQRIVMELARCQAEREADVLRRANGAERTRRWRERHVTSRNVTVTDVTECDVTSLARAQPLTNTNLSTSLSKKEREESKEGRKEGARRGFSLSDAWAPNEGHFAEALAAGKTRDWVIREADSMRDWAIANSHRQVARKSNWDRAFMSWIRREIKQSTGEQNGRRATLSENSTSAVAKRIYFEELERERTAEASSMGKMPFVHGR